MKDTAHKAADAEIEAFKREIKSVYLQAQTTAQAQLDKFLQTFEDEDNTKRLQVEAGELSKDEWQSWRKSKLLHGKRLKITLENMAAAYANADKVAMAALNNRLPAVYADNANFGAWQACQASGLNLSFNMLDADTVQHMLTAGEALFAQPATDVAKAKAWTAKLMRSQLTQGVMLGESIPKIAKRLQNVTNSNYKVAVRTARTAVTGAQNAGRTNSYKRAQSMGVKLKQEWLATLDLRTRHSHRRLDGEKVEIGKKFSNGLLYPADPNGSYAEIMNCRCTLVAALDGVSDDASKRWSKLPKGMTYEQWKGLNKAYSSLKLQLDTGESISANIVRNVLKPFIPLGAEAGKNAADYLNLGDMPNRKVKLFDEAMKYVPTKMLRELKRNNVKASWSNALERSEYDPATNTITIDKRADALSVVHEIMHAVEEHDSDFLKAERKYFKQRTDGKKLEKLSKITGNNEYRAFEKAYIVEKCIEPYTFKDYDGEGYELMSVGVETLYRSPLSFKNDLNMLQWVLSMLGRFGV